MNKKLVFVIAFTSIIIPIAGKNATAKAIESSIDSLRVQSNSNLLNDNLSTLTKPRNSTPELSLKNKKNDADKGNPQGIPTSTELSTKLPNGLSSHIDSTSIVAKESSINSLKMRPDFNPLIIQASSPVPSTPPINIVSPDPNNKPIGWGEVKFSSTNSPAAKLIGTDEGEIQNISTPAELSVKLLNGLNSDGDFAPTLAVDMLPYTLLKGKDLTLSNYRNSSFERFLANTKLSIATNKVMENSGSAHLGVGLEFVLINNGDLRNDQCLMKDIKYISEHEKDSKLESCISDIRPQVGVAVPSLIPCGTKDEECRKNKENNNRIYVEYIDKQYLIAKKAAEKRGDQASIWTAALGSSWVSPNGRYNNLQGEGMGFWTTYKQGINTNSQLLFHASYRTNERLKVNGGNNEFVNADTLVGGVRLLSGDRNFRFSLETTYNRESPSGGKPNNDYLYYGLGVEP